MNMLGEAFIKQAMQAHALVDDRDRLLIDLDSFVMFMQKFQYICNLEDRNELRVWLFNKNLFLNPPKYYDQEALFIDLEALIQELKLLK
mmetsp:Transcript_14740/g.14348  ORF Transcript_14740/g.14348 Transcript_14740/m.14348 type:complete len:89 (+) Transcript_14740:415-681(+)